MRLVQPGTDIRLHPGPTAGMTCGGRGRTFESCRAHSSQLARTKGNQGRDSERSLVADLLQFLTLKHNRDPSERVELALRRIFFGLLALVAVAGLLNVFGQRPTESRAATSIADLRVFAPEAIRGGLYYEGRFTVEAKEEIDHATLVLDGGWTEQLQINTIEPSPIGEASRGGRLALDFGHLDAGHKLVVFLQYQVNPANVGRRSQDVVGDLLQQGVTQNDLSFTGLVLAVGMFGLLTLAMSYAGWRFPRVRPLLEPEPLILVEDGKVIERNLRWALLESGGRISFIPKSPS